MTKGREVSAWIADKIQKNYPSVCAELLDAGLLRIQADHKPSFLAAAIGVPDIVRSSHVAPLFSSRLARPEFVVNVPSKAIWSGEAIDVVHGAPAAFGSLKDLIGASSEVPASGYRNKEYAFFERAFRQHSAVRSITRCYDRVYRLSRKSGADIVVVVINAYDLSAEDVRNARDMYGSFDVCLKSMPYGSVTSSAREAASMIGVKALDIKSFLRGLEYM